MVTKLEVKIKHHIKENGPLTIAEYMQYALFDLEYGYYRRVNPFGEGGDFITAPEISQIFGELIGCYAAFKWQNSGKPKKYNIIELGAGNGTLLNDFLRATKGVKGFHSSLTIYIVELSERLQKIQLSNLEKYQIKIVHLKEFSEIKSRDLSFIYANEFFDALPINQYIYSQEKKCWYERMVALDKDNNLCFHNYGSVDLLLQKYLSKEVLTNIERADQDIYYEISNTAISIINNICEFCVETCSSGVFVDYGYIRKVEELVSYENSFQALRNHNYASPLQKVGECDLTALVDFSLLYKQSISHSLKTDILTQREFLLSLGILERKKILLNSINDAGLIKKIENSTSRLIDLDKMGELFKVLLIN